MACELGMIVTAVNSSADPPLTVSVAVPPTTFPPPGGVYSAVMVAVPCPDPVASPAFTPETIMLAICALLELHTS